MMEDSFEIHRRVGWYSFVLVAALLLAGGFGWCAWDLSEPLLFIPAAALLLVALVMVRTVLDPSTPLLVADPHGVRMRHGESWIGLLWSEMGEIRIEPREGWRFDPRVKVISSDGRHVYAAPVGLATRVSPAEAAEQLARLRRGDAY